MRQAWIVGAGFFAIAIFMLVTQLSLVKWFNLGGYLGFTDRRMLWTGMAISLAGMVIVAAWSMGSELRSKPR